MEFISKITQQYFKYILCILLLLLLIEIITLRIDNCSKCNFKINDSYYSTKYFFKLYYNKCLKKTPEIYSLNVNMSELYLAKDA